MTGIPLQVNRDNGWETVYLSTIRHGDIGELLKKQKAVCRKLKREFAALAKSAALAGLAAGKAKDGPMADLEALSARQDETMRRLDETEELLLKAGEELGLTALAANYGKAEAFAIMDCLTDAQILRIPGILESGETPEDFFPSSGQPPSGPGMPPNIATGADSALNTARSRQKG